MGDRAGYVSREPFPSQISSSEAGERSLDDTTTGAPGFVTNVPWHGETVSLDARRADPTTGLHSGPLVSVTDAQLSGTVYRYSEVVDVREWRKVILYVQYKPQAPDQVLSMILETRAGDGMEWFPYSMMNGCFAHQNPAPAHTGVGGAFGDFWAVRSVYPAEVRTPNSLRAENAAGEYEEVRVTVPWDVAGFRQCRFLFKETTVTDENLPAPGAGTGLVTFSYSVSV